MNRFLKIIGLLFVFALVNVNVLKAQDQEVVVGESNELNVREFIMEHVSDSYEWHVTKIADTDVVIPLPIIVYSETSGWHFFLSSAFRENTEFQGLTIATDGKYKGKIVEITENGQFARPYDISITKVSFALLINSLLLIVIIMFVAKHYKNEKLESKKGFIGFMELFIMDINNEVIKPSLGKNYKRFSPYLLTVFFFVLLNNLMGLVPFFPGGANVTGNIAITFVLAIITFFIVNISGTKEYWKEIFWPDVPLLLKFPIPLLPIIEVVSVFTKPFALMIRLFANMLAGHSITLGLTCLIFVTVSLGQAMNTSMTLVSVVLTVFINVIEVLVAYIQAYIFTMLSALFIGLAIVEPHHAKEKSEIKN